MSMEHSPATPSPDDFDRQLRDLTSGSAGAARFRELSAEERARQAAKRAPRQPTGLRGLAKARRLRRPASSPDPGRSGPSRWRRRRLKVVGGRGSARPGPGMRHARLRSAAKTAAILVGFVALLLILHLIGFGPQ
jgi:hypothetical protein